jgi:hypothetical protein
MILPPRDGQTKCSEVAPRRQAGRHGEGRRALARGYGIGGEEMQQPLTQVVPKTQPMISPSAPICPQVYVPVGQVRVVQQPFKQLSPSSQEA